MFRMDTGPTAWLAPIYPLLVAGIFKIFGIFTTRAFFAAVFLNILFSSAACVPIYFAGKRVGGLGVASMAAWLWALFPNAIMMPFEWIWDTSLSALLAATILWATLALAESDQRLGMVCIRVVMGIRADDESSARRAATIFARMACLPRQAPCGLAEPFALETRRRNGRRYHAVLRALDDPQLHRFSSICSIAFKPAFRTVAREQ